MEKKMNLFCEKRRRVMEKTPRYTQRERNMILGYAAHYKDIIENKRTDAESNRRKDEVWRSIAKDFNSRVFHQRTAKQLRQLYKNMKLLLKKDLTNDGRTRDFMDILNGLSQQTALFPFVTYRQSYRTCEDEARGSSCSFTSDYPDNDIIKTEDISDNEQSHQDDDMDDDDDIDQDVVPEVCLDDNDDKCASLLTWAIEERKRKIDLLNAQIEYWKALTRRLESATNHCHCHLPQAVNNGVSQS